jgi:hypothetical protein
LLDDKSLPALADDGMTEELLPAGDVEQGVNDAAVE